jgi:hypothetical protein
MVMALLMAMITVAMMVVVSGHFANTRDSDNDLKS